MNYSEVKEAAATTANELPKARRAEMAALIDEVERTDERDRFGVLHRVYREFVAIARPDYVRVIVAGAFKLALLVGLVWFIVRMVSE